MRQILVTGANGQLGSELTEALADTYGAPNVTASDLHDQPTSWNNGSIAYRKLDVTDSAAVREMVEKNGIDAIFHLASLLSVRGEQAPDRAWDVNTNGLKVVLDLARERSLQVFWPSSIAVFGDETPRNAAPQSTILDPRTMYGITKMAGELLCKYYCARFGVDVRSVRYPGLVSYKTAPGGGTTDYAVEMFYAAAAGTEYTCFLRPETRLPMMYMPDAVRAALAIMTASRERLTVRSSYNVSAVSFSAEELAHAIRQRLPDFRIRFVPDRRQEIADSWPQTVDDTKARDDWGWQPKYVLAAIADDMLDHLLKKNSAYYE